MPKETQALQSTGRKCRKPSERTALFILNIFGWIRDIVTSTNTTIPRGQVFLHHGNYLSAGKVIRYPHILLVEDNPNTAMDFTETIKNYYVFGTVKILVAHAFDAAETFFANEDIDLVIMDADLDDEDGDGAVLTQKFHKEKPDLTILANSSSRISNLKLTGFGAVVPLGKSTDKLKNWLLVNDPIGSAG